MELHRHPAGAPVRRPARGSRRSRVRLAGALVSGLLAACVHAPPRLDFGPRGRLTEPAEAFAAVEARLEKLRSVQGDARATIRSPSGNAAIDELVAAERPARARLEATTLLGPVATFTTDGATFALTDWKRHRFQRGPATSDAVGLLVPVRLPPEEFVSLLLGVPPLVAGAKPKSLAIDDRRGVYLLSLSGEGRERLVLDTRTLRPLEVELDRRGDLSAYRATFDDYEAPGDLPRLVRLESGDVSVTLRWRDREVNLPLDPAMFRQTGSAGAPVVP